MLKSRVRILYVSSHWPHGQTYGGQLRTLHIGRLLQQCGDVRLLLVRRTEVPQSVVTKSREEFCVETVLRLHETPINGLQARMRHELDPWFCNTHGLALKPEDTRTVRDLIAKSDLVWIHDIATANAAGIRCWPSSVLDVDNVCSQLEHSAALNGKSWAQRLLSWRRMLLWKRRESVFLKRFDVLAVCSEADRRYLGGGDRVHIIPNGFELPAEEPKRSPAAVPTIGFIGTLKYPPNREGVEWFIRQVWPRIKKACPAGRLRLVGAGSDTGFSQIGPDVDGLGWVENASEEMQTWSLSIVPVRVGGGTRIKIAESFSRKIPVVSTTWGAFGYGVTSGNELLLADEADAFGKACLSILQDPELGNTLASLAWDRYVKHWTWQAIGPRVAGAVENCLRNSKIPR